MISIHCEFKTVIFFHLKVVKKRSRLFFESFSAAYGNLIMVLFGQRLLDEIHLETEH